MKKVLFPILAGLSVLLLTACAGNAGKTAGAPQNSVSAVLESQMASPVPAQHPDESEAPVPQREPSAPVDIDLTAMSGTMVYSEVYDMLAEPDRYIGKTVRMHGNFALYQSVDADGLPIPGTRYFACIIQDATACCSRGLEFVLEGNYRYPEDYPRIGTPITVEGTFDTYDEEGVRFCHLTNASLTRNTPVFIPPK